MKLFYISIAAAAVLAAGGNCAAAQTVWVAGSSSSTRAQYEAFVSNCNAPLNIYIYMSGSGSTGNPVTPTSRPGDTGTGNYFLYSCIIHAAKTSVFKTWDALQVSMYHTVDGGSKNAFDPPASLRRINPSGGGCMEVTGMLDAVKVFKNCSTATNSALPDGGFSDLEHVFWGSFPVTPLPVNVAQVFGVAVTDELYKAMQAKEIADGKGVSTGIAMNPLCYGIFVPGNCQPNITRDQYRSIISAGNSGVYQIDWNPLVDKGSTPSVYEGNGKVVRVCRRVDTSGTQASSNAYFLENPCRQWFDAPGQLFPSRHNTALNINDDVPGAYDVVENSGTGDVKACLTNSNNLVSKTGSVNGAGGDYTSTAATNFAIGVMSAENIVGDGWKYIKLDGASPDLHIKQRAAGAQGKYGFVMEMFYYKTGSVAAGFLDELATDMADPVLGLTGVFVSPTNGTYDGDKVGSGAKFGNNCAPQTLFF